MAGLTITVLGTLAAPAVAEECPDLQSQTVEALARYDAGEVDAAKGVVARGYAALACQTRLVPTSVLLDLYRVDALVALTLGDPKGMVYATLRAVAAQHEGGRPPDLFGPDLQAQYDTWSARLRQDLVTVRVLDDGTAYVDGRSVDVGHPLEVVEGEHLIQVPSGGEAVSSRIVELSGDFPITTGIGVPVSPGLVELEPITDRAPKAARRRPAPLVVGALVSAGAAGLAFASGHRSDRNFQGSPYLADSYKDCPRGEACYPEARLRAIQADVFRINLAYGLGYGLSAVSSGLVVFTVVGLSPRD